MSSKYVCAIGAVIAAAGAGYSMVHGFTIITLGYGLCAVLLFLGVLV